MPTGAKLRLFPPHHLQVGSTSRVRHLHWLFDALGRDAMGRGLKVMGQRQGQNLFDIFGWDDVRSYNNIVQKLSGCSPGELFV